MTVYRSSVSGQSSQNGRVGSTQRFSPSHPCPICGGCDRDRRGQGSRCHGFLSDDGEWAHCSREEHAGNAPFNERSKTFAHRLKGECKCGREHGPADPAPTRKPKPKAKPNAKPKASLGRIVATYDYEDDAGEVLFQCVRYEPKDFRQRRPDGKGGWIWNLEGVKLVPYNLCGLIQTDPRQTVWVCEGEKDADRLESEGKVATTNPMGAEKWGDELSPYFEGRLAVILSDNDEIGRRHADMVARSLSPHASPIKVLDLAAACEALGLGTFPEKGDVCDFLGMGGTVEDLQRLADETKPWALPKVGIGGFGGGSQGENAPEEPPSDDPFGGFGGDPPEPKPIRADLLPIARMFPELLPPILRPWLSDIAERVGCPLDYVAVGAIVAVAALTGRKVGIRPKRKDDWKVICNLWGAAVGRPGWLKSPALAEVMKPLFRLVKEADERHSREVESFNASALLARTEAEAAKDQLKAAVKAKKSQAELEALATKATAPSSLSEPKAKRYVVNDPTVEKLGMILCENPNGVLLFRDELMGWLRSLDKPGRETDRQFYLEAWNGNGRSGSDRVGRGRTEPPALCVSILGSIQPGPLFPYLRSASSGEGEENDGLISRFQLLVYPDPMGEWKNVDRWPDTESKNKAFELFRWIDNLSPASIGAEPDEEDGVPFLRFTHDAQDFFDSWRTDLENNKLRTEDESALIESHLAKFRSLMPSLALVFHLADAAEGWVTGPVSLKAATLAAAWCDYLESHIRRIYQATFDSDPEPGRRLAERIKKGDVPSPFTARWIFKRDWSGLTTMEGVGRAIACLERHDWIRGVERQSEKGGRPTEDFYINPRLPHKKEGGSQ